MARAPGLIKTEIVEDDGEFVTIVETWDLRAPGCPLIAVDKTRVAASNVVCWRRVHKFEFSEMFP